MQGQSLPPIDNVRAVSPSQLSLPTEAVAPPITSPPPTSSETSFYSPGGSSPLIRGSVSSSRTQPPRFRFTWSVTVKSWTVFIRYFWILVLLAAIYEGFNNGIIGVFGALFVGSVVWGGLLATSFVFGRVWLLYSKSVEPDER
jgi:hypothetical protein